MIIMIIQSLQFQLTRPMRSVTGYTAEHYPKEVISTHTPHAERDLMCFSYLYYFSVISTHTPHAERDGNVWFESQIKDISTHTPHAERDNDYWNVMFVIHISTHTPHAERDVFIQSIIFSIKISTHTPHAERDRVILQIQMRQKFQLTRPMRSVTVFDVYNR